MNAIVYAAVGIAGALSAISGGITVGQLSSFLIYANQYTKPVSYTHLDVYKRQAYYMVKDGIEKGLISDGTVIVESTSGNTGIALAYICTCLGLRLIITRPESMSVERRNLLAALGAELVLTPAAEGMRGAIKKAREICEKEKGYMVGQFENPANAQAHRETTAVEIMRDLVAVSYTHLEVYKRQAYFTSCD